MDSPHYELLQPQRTKAVLLIVDNHSSHRDLHVVNYCKQNYIDLVSLPRHASHRMQPLDVGFFNPLKNAFSRENDKWMVNHPRYVITQLQVAELFNAAYGAAANI